MRFGLAAPFVAARVADHAGRPAAARHEIVVHAVQVTVQPEVGVRQQPSSALQKLALPLRAP